MLNPKDPYWASVLRNRRPLAYPPLNRMDAFSSFTIEIIAQALRNLIDCERTAEASRKNLYNKSYINMVQVFKGIDRNRDGYICPSELRKALNATGVASRAEDTDGLIERYDKDGDGRISYSEFIQEVSPKV